MSSLPLGYHQTLENARKHAVMFVRLVDEAMVPKTPVEAYNRIALIEQAFAQLAKQYWDLNTLSNVLGKEISIGGSSPSS